MNQTALNVVNPLKSADLRALSIFFACKIFMLMIL